MKLRCLIANSLWALSCQPARWRQWRALKNPALAQQRVLQRLLQQHATSAFGQQHRFSELRTVEAFQKQIPMSDYESLTPWIDRAKAGEFDVLACGEIRAFELSSGSTSAAKFIPCTARSLAEFNEAVRAWMGHLFAHHLNLLGGPSWWIVSTLKRLTIKTTGGIPVGLESDLDYLSRWERWLASWIFVSTPPLSDFDTSLDAVADSLSNAHEIRLISVWNPSILPLLLDKIALPSEKAWPKLRIISAWADSWAANNAERLRELFPMAQIQPKGLLATEGVVTIPWGNREGSVPALNSHFFEFLDSSGHTHLIHELKTECDYEVILSTSAGLWRYRLGDAVRVVGWEGPTPRLRFMGRVDGVCDLRGEKLHPSFIGTILRPLGASFAMLAPLSSLDGYGLFVDLPVDEVKLDDSLCANPHYAYCRRIGQLTQVRVFHIQPDAAAEYLRRCLSLGQRPGTIKSTALHSTPGWEHWFNEVLR